MSVIQFQPATVTEPDATTLAQAQLKDIGIELSEALSEWCNMRRAIKDGHKLNIADAAATIAVLAGDAMSKARDIEVAYRKELFR